MTTSSTPTPLLSPALLARLEQMELVSRKIFRGQMKGERRSRRKGQSVEFADFRNYVPGDDLRFIDWNLYARLDKLFLKLFLEEEDLHFYTLIDTSESMNFGNPTKLQYAKQIAAALGYIGLCRADRVKIETMDQTLRQRSPVFRGRKSLWQMMKLVNEIESQPFENLTVAAKNFTLRNSGKGILVLISDLMDKTGYENALRFLLTKQWDIYLVHVLSESEIKPDLAGDIRLIDCEDHDSTEITVSPRLLQRYTETLNQFVGQARHFCARRGIAYTLTSTVRSVDDLILRHLRQIGLVK